MLVLSRREHEKIVFPTLRTSVEVLEVKSGRVRLGIEAPPEVQILREEVMASSKARQSGVSPMPITATASANGESDQLRKLRHDLRNRLNSGSVGLALARRQLDAGMLDELEQTLEILARGFQSAEGDLQQPTDRTLPAAAQRQPEALLVEDDTNECELLAGFLRLAGYKVNTAHDGADALDRLRTGSQPDVMLLDMNLPRCDGVTTVKMIRCDPKLANLKIYAVTGYSAQQLGVDEKHSGLNGWFQKPLDPERLLGELQTARFSSIHALKASGLGANRKNLLFAGQEAFDHLRVEMFARRLHDNGPRNVMAVRIFVNTLGTERIVHVGHGQDAARERNFFPTQPVRVTAAVPTFVMRGGNFASHFQELGVRKQIKRCPQRFSP
jgi:carbon storage regulator CsrA